MTASTDQEIEERLRDHYRHLREPPQTPRIRHRQAHILVPVACLALILAAGAAYVTIRSSDPGQPIQTDVGPSADNATRPTATPPTAVATDSTLDSELNTNAEPDSGATTTTAAPGSDAAPESINGDGSPVAPTPGTVSPPAGADFGMAYGIWEPGEHDTCSKAVHDQYWVYGPDGKVYPTYHPPVDPTSGCTFGHEHGRDPAGSDLADIPFPFGYVNEQAVASGASDPHEDHVGHKIEWYNNGGYYQRGSANTNHDQICDVAYKLHMGTHSDDAFANNAHEVFHYARCENGSELIYRALHTFGDAGEFNMHCDQGTGPTVTIDQGNTRNDDRGGTRELPAQQCFEDRVLVPEGQESDWFPFDERWTLYQSVDSDDFGRFFIQFYFFADVPSRYWNGEELARTIDLCYITGDRQVRGDEYCDPMRAATPGRRVLWDDPASPFNGADRKVFMVDIRLDNAAQQNDWYTDIHGGVWSAQPFPGSIRQHVGTTPLDAAASYEPSPIRAIEFDDGLGIHAPN